MEYFKNIAHARLHAPKLFWNSNHINITDYNTNIIRSHKHIQYYNGYSYAGNHNIIIFVRSFQYNVPTLCINLHQLNPFETCTLLPQYTIKQNSDST